MIALVLMEEGKKGLASASVWKAVESVVLLMQALSGSFRCIPASYHAALQIEITKAQGHQAGILDAVCSGREGGVVDKQRPM